MQATAGQQLLNFETKVGVAVTKAEVVIEGDIPTSEIFIRSSDDLKSKSSCNSIRCLQDTCIRIIL